MPPLKRDSMRFLGGDMLSYAPPAQWVQAIQMDRSTARGRPLLRGSIVLTSSWEKERRVEPREIYQFYLVAGLLQCLRPSIIVNRDSPTKWC